MKKIEIQLTDIEVKILLNDLVDIDEWVRGCIAGKINNCKKRAASAYRETLKKEGAELVPSSDDIAVQQLFSRSDYKNRVEREFDELKDLQKHSPKPI